MSAARFSSRQRIAKSALVLLKHHAELYPTDVLGFCLMTNHVHLLLRPHSAPSLAQLMRMVQMRYSQYRHAGENRDRRGFPAFRGESLGRTDTRFHAKTSRGRYPPCPHHIAQRGNERREIFFTPADREVYLGLLKHHAEFYPTDVS